jgi:hypothetical protein
VDQSDAEADDVEHGFPPGDVVRSEQVVDATPGEDLAVVDRGEQEAERREGHQARPEHHAEAVERRQPLVP